MAKKKTQFLVHCDGSVKDEGSMSSFVIVSQDDDLVYQDVFRDRFYDINVAEIFALRRAIEECLRQGVRDVTFVSDAMHIVLMVKNKKRTFKGKHQAELNFQLLVIRALLRKFDRVRVIHRKREYNKYADSLCHLGWKNIKVKRSGGKVDVTKEAVMG